MEDTPMTDDEFADSRANHARWSAIVTLTVCSGLSMVGGWYYAVTYGAGTVAAALGTIAITVVLILAIHLRSAVRAAREVARVSEATYRVSSVGGGVLVLMALVGNFATLHALAVELTLHPITAVLAPVALDVGVVIATNAIFSLRPRLARSRTSRARTQSAQVKPPAPRSAARTSASVPTPAVQRARAPESAPSVRSAGDAAGLTPRSEGSTVRADVDPAVQARAAELVSSGATSKSVDEVAAVLALNAAGASVTRIASATGIHHKTIKGILTAATEPRDTRSLAAVS